MRNLAIVVLAFNNFATIPTVLLQSQHAQYQVCIIYFGDSHVAMVALFLHLLYYVAHIFKIKTKECINAMYKCQVLSHIPLLYNK